MTVLSTIPAKPVVTAMARNTKGALKSRFKLHVNHGQALSLVADMFGCASSNALLARAGETAAPAQNTPENSNDQGALLVQLAAVVNNLSPDTLDAHQLNGLRIYLNTMVPETMAPVDKTMTEQLLREFGAILKPHAYLTKDWEILFRLIEETGNARYTPSGKNLLCQAALATFQFMHRNFLLNEWTDLDNRHQKACIAALQKLPCAYIQRQLLPGDFVVRLTLGSYILGKIVAVNEHGIFSVAHVDRVTQKASVHTEEMAAYALIGFEAPPQEAQDFGPALHATARVHLANGTIRAIVNNEETFDVTPYFSTLSDAALYSIDLDEHLNTIANQLYNVGEFPAWKKLNADLAMSQKNTPEENLHMSRIVCEIDPRVYADWVRKTRPHINM